MRDNKKRIFKRFAQVMTSLIITIVFVGGLALLLQGKAIPVLQPEGTIAQQQYILILITVGLGLFVVLPVFILLFTIAWKYREGNTKAQYDPNLHGHKGLEFVWWGIPALIIIVLAIITAISTYALDPYKPLASDKKPVEVQVVALQWRWLFIYPEYGIATVNYVNFPEQTPLNLTISADSPMNAFWVPALGGQVYAMTGMSTKLHLMADATGTYDGMSSNISGEGFAHMRFKANSLSQQDFERWIDESTASEEWLTSEAYNELALPSEDTSQKTYGIVQPGLYDAILMKYMGSGSHGSEGHE